MSSLFTSSLLLTAFCREADDIKKNNFIEHDVPGIWQLHDSSILQRITDISWNIYLGFKQAETTSPTMFAGIIMILWLGRFNWCTVVLLLYNMYQKWWQGILPNKGVRTRKILNGIARKKPYCKFLTSFFWSKISNN